MTEKVSCGGLIEKGDHCLVEVLGFHQVANEPCGILTRFGEAGITLAYLSVGNGSDGTTNMSFCVRTADLARRRQLLDDIRTDFQPQLVAANAPVVILTLSGPHFLERTSLASRVFSALCADGIRPHTVCSSVNSISVVVDTHDRDTAVACLKRNFSWPD
jgi:aspartokinase